MEKRSAVRPQGRLSCTAVQQAIIDKIKILLNSTLSIISPEGYRQSRLKKEESGYSFVSV